MFCESFVIGFELTNVLSSLGMCAIALYYTVSATCSDKPFTFSSIAIFNCGVWSTVYHATFSPLTGSLDVAGMYIAAIVFWSEVLMCVDCIRLRWMFLSLAWLTGLGLMMNDLTPGSGANPAVTFGTLLGVIVVTVLIVKARDELRASWQQIGAVFLLLCVAGGLWLTTELNCPQQTWARYFFWGHSVWHLSTAFAVCYLSYML